MTEPVASSRTRDASKMPQPRWVKRAMLGILVLAAAVRIWGLDFGLPYEGITYKVVQIEESQEVMRALKLGAGEYSWSFGKGGLYLLLFVEYGVLFAVSWLAGWADRSCSPPSRRSSSPSTVSGSCSAGWGSWTASSRFS